MDPKLAECNRHHHNLMMGTNTFVSVFPLLYSNIAHRSNKFIRSFLSTTPSIPAYTIAKD
ncbi:hypothetical protein DERF_002872 [Dermatophagoides farinae]|uniref:Uncharacterized protein n=1 Tax=Dermatophagoides farinae TaxID=6954 RepID=A0A922IE04_DERFA|nr:hypothetical protein DERF_002872 [Dermatophagoides farinae]